MTKQIHFYAFFYGPGSFVAETWTQDVQSADPAAVQWSGNAYAFTLHQREDVIVDGKTYRGVPEQIGPLYYHPDSRIETAEQVKSNPRATDVLLSNMRCNGWDRIIWTRWGTWPQPYDAARMTILSNQPAAGLLTDEGGVSG